MIKEDSLTTPKTPRKPRGGSVMTLETIIVLALIVLPMITFLWFALTVPRGLEPGRTVELQPGTQLVVGRLTPTGFAHDPVAIFTRDGQFVMGVRRRVNLDKSISLLNEQGDELFNISWPNGPEQPPSVRSDLAFTGIEQSP